MQYWQMLESDQPQEKFCYGWLHRRLLRRYRPQSAMNCSTLQEQTAGSLPNTSQVSLLLKDRGMCHKSLLIFHVAYISDDGLTLHGSSVIPPLKYLTPGRKQHWIPHGHDMCCQCFSAQSYCPSYILHRLSEPRSRRRDSHAQSSQKVCGLVNFSTELRKSL